MAKRGLQDRATVLLDLLHGQVGGGGPLQAGEIVPLTQRQWEAVQFEARESLVGRMYSRALLTRVQEILKK